MTDSRHQAAIDRARANGAVMSTIALSTMTATARKEHWALAEMSHIARLAAERIQQTGADLAAIAEMLRAIQNAGHLEYLRHNGAETDYAVIGAKVEKRYRTPGGKWKRPA